MNKEFFQKLLKKEWHIPFAHKAMRVIQAFSLTEKVIFFFFVGMFFLSSILLLWQVNKSFLVEVPDYGGSLTEGIIGSPRFVNPLLAISDADRDLTTLVYSGLMKVKLDGTLVPDLAQSYTISDDGLVYTFILKKNIKFQDGKQITADDVIFTIDEAKDSTLKSPRKSNWDGVTVKKIDDLTVQFILKQPYSPFIQNTTLGILPKHIWKTANSEEFPFSQYNTKAIGSGPYKINSITYTSGGLPSEYHLVAFDDYALGKPFITNINIKSYQTEKDLVSAYNNGDIENIHGISGDKMVDLKSSDNKTMVSPLPRVFGVFFNQNAAPIFVNAEVRQALNMITDREEIVKTVLNGYGQPAFEPIPPKEVNASKMTTFDADAEVAKAKALLISKGWKQDQSGIFEKTDKKSNIVLAFSISTSDAPELKKVAQLLQKQWQKIGAKVDIKIFEVSDLNQNIIRPRKYDSLLFGEVIGRDMDLYPFWHSSQRVDPGLNIALYTNIKADKTLDTIRKTTDTQKQDILYKDFNTEINTDMPAVFVYAPYFTYIVPKKIHNIQLGQLTTPAERFDNISEWYIQTNNIWKIFLRENKNADETN